MTAVAFSLHFSWAFGQAHIQGPQQQTMNRQGSHPNPSVIPKGFRRIERSFFTIHDLDHIGDAVCGVGLNIMRIILINSS
jgi:hypothetical protein